MSSAILLSLLGLGPALAAPLDLRALTDAPDPEALERALDPWYGVRSVDRAEGLAVLEAAIGRMAREPDAAWRAHALLDVAEAIAGRDPQTDARLLDLRHELSEPSSFLSERLVYAVLMGQVREEVAQLVQTRPPRLALARPGALPPHLAGQPAAVRAAWRQYRGLAGPQPYGFPDEQSESVMADASPFVQAVEDLLRGRPGDHAAILSRYVWGIGCGTGREQFLWPRANALFLATVREERHDEAVAHALQAARWDGGPWIRDYLAWLGFDPVALYLGGAVHDLDETYLSALSWIGGDEAARAALLAGDIDASTEYDWASWRRTWIDSLDRYVPRREPPGRVDPFPTPPISPETEARVLDTLSALVREGAPEQELVSAVWAMRRLQRPEGAAALRRAAAMPIPSVASLAAEALSELGPSASAPR